MVLVFKPFSLVCVICNHALDQDNELLSDTQ